MRLIVEGKSDEVFIMQYCRFLNKEINIEKIAIANGKDNLIHHKDIRKYRTLIIFDADDDYNKSKEDILFQLQKMEVDINEYPVFLVPNNQDSGNLGTLIEKIGLYPNILTVLSGVLRLYKISNERGYEFQAAR